MSTSPGGWQHSGLPLLPSFCPATTSGSGRPALCSPLSPSPPPPKSPREAALLLCAETPWRPHPRGQDLHHVPSDSQIRASGRPVCPPRPPLTRLHKPHVPEGTRCPRPLVSHRGTPPWSPRDAPDLSAPHLHTAPPPCPDHLSRCAAATDTKVMAKRDSDSSGGGRPKSPGGSAPQLRASPPRHTRVQRLCDRAPPHPRAPAVCRPGTHAPFLPCRRPGLGASAHGSEGVRRSQRQPRPLGPRCASLRRTLRHDSTCSHSACRLPAAARLKHPKSGGSVGLRPPRAGAQHPTPLADWLGGILERTGQSPSTSVGKGLTSLSRRNTP